MTDYRLSAVSDSNVWDAFVAASPQGSIWMSSSLLGSLGVEPECLFLKEDGVPVAAAVVLRKDGKVLFDPVPLAIYTGVCLSTALGSFPAHKRVPWVAKVMGRLLEATLDKYGGVCWVLHHALKDLRGFQWEEFTRTKSNGTGRLELLLRYSGIVSVADYPSWEAYLMSVRKCRRYEMRKAEKDAFAIEASDDLGLFRDLYKETFQRQGIEVAGSQIELAVAMTGSALEHGYGEMLISRSPKGEPASATVFFYDSHAGYYIFGCNHPEFRKSGASSFLLMENIRRGFARGLQWIDLVGVNSPNRGDFKTSFNAEPVPFFVLRYLNDD